MSIEDELTDMFEEELRFSGGRMVTLPATYTMEVNENNSDWICTEHGESWKVVDGVNHGCPQCKKEAN